MKNNQQILVFVKLYLFFYLLLLIFLKYLILVLIIDRFMELLFSSSFFIFISVIYRYF